MIVDALESVYVTVRRFQQRQVEGSPRLNSAFVLALIMTPVLMAVLSLVLGPGGVMNAALGMPVYRHTTRLSLLAFLLASIIAALFFDRRRAAIDLKFASLPSLESTVSKTVAWLGVLLTIALESAFSTRMPIASLGIFLFACLGLSIFLRRIESRS